MRIRFLGNKINILTPAKVNLFLELLGRREDGFHQLETVISSVSLFDSLYIRPRDDGQIRIQLTQTHKVAGEHIPTDERNLIFKAMDLVRRTFLATAPGPGTGNFGADVECVKRIPSQAGLGGASGNAAGAMVAANWLWKCRLSLGQLQHSAAQLGSDVPFFLSGGTAICHGRGEKVQGLLGPTGHWLVIAKPPVGLATGDVFQNCSVPARHLSSASLVENLSIGNVRKIGSKLFNRLQESASSMTSWIERFRASFSRVNSLGHQMTGSGSSYFGVFSSRITANRAAHCLSNRHPDAKIFTCRTLNRIRCLPPCSLVE